MREEKAEYYKLTFLLGMNQFIFKSILSSIAITAAAPIGILATIISPLLLCSRTRNDAKVFLCLLGYVIGMPGSIITALPAIILSPIAGLINQRSRSFINKQTIDRTCERLLIIRSYSLMQKKALINAIVQTYNKESSYFSSRSSRKLMNGLSNRKHVDKHINQLLGYILQKDEDNKLHYNNGKRLFNLICKKVQQFDEQAKPEPIIDPITKQETQDPVMINGSLCYRHDDANQDETNAEALAQLDDRCFIDRSTLLQLCGGATSTAADWLQSLSNPSISDGYRLMVTEDGQRRLQHITDGQVDREYELNYSIDAINQMSVDTANAANDAYSHNQNQQFVSFGKPPSSKLKWIKQLFSNMTAETLPKPMIQTSAPPSYYDPHLRISRL